MRPVTDLTSVEHQQLSLGDPARAAVASYVSRRQSLDAAGAVDKDSASGLKKIGKDLSKSEIYALFPHLAPKEDSHLASDDELERELVILRDRHGPFIGKLYTQFGAPRVTIQETTKGWKVAVDCSTVPGFLSGFQPTTDSSIPLAVIVESAGEQKHREAIRVAIGEVADSTIIGFKGTSKANRSIRVVEETSGITLAQLDPGD